MRSSGHFCARWFSLPRPPFQPSRFIAPHPLFFHSFIYFMHRSPPPVNLHLFLSLHNVTPVTQNIPENGATMPLLELSNRYRSQWQDPGWSCYGVLWMYYVKAMDVLRQSYGCITSKLWMLYILFQYGGLLKCKQKQLLFTIPHQYIVTR